MPTLTVNRVVTLPAPQVGLHFRFMAIPTGANLTHSATITAVGLINGAVMNDNAGAAALTAKQLTPSH